MMRPKWSLWAVVGVAIVCMTPHFPSLLSGGTDHGFHGNETSVQNHGAPLRQPISTPATKHTRMSCSWGQPANTSPQLVPSICISRTVLCVPSQCGTPGPTFTLVTLIVNASANTSYTGPVVLGSRQDLFQFIPAAGFQMGPGGTTYNCIHNGTNADGLCQNAPLFPVSDGMGWGWPYPKMYPNDSWSASFNVSVTSAFPTTQQNNLTPIDVCILPGCLGGNPYSEVRYSNFQRHGVNTSFQPAFVNVTDLPTTYQVTYGENGLPYGTLWGLYFNEAATAYTTTTQDLVVNVTNGSYVYYPLDVPGYFPYPTSGSVIVNGSDPPVIGIQYYPAPRGTFPVIFSEQGIPIGTPCSLTVGNQTMSTSNGTQEFDLPNGTYAWGVGGVIGYMASPGTATGNISVAGSAVSETIPFTKIPSFNSTVVFKEDGLPAGTSWSVGIAPQRSGPTPPPPVESLSSVSPEIAFSLGNGSYDVQPSTGSRLFAPSAFNGSINVSGTTVYELVDFARVFTVDWEEHGLPPAVGWDLIWNESLTLESSQPAQNVTMDDVRNGTYSYEILPVDGFVPESPSGNVTVQGKDVVVNVTFVKTPSGRYSAVFEQTGLSPNVEWSIGVGTNILQGSVPALVATNLTNGTYSFYVGPETGFSPDLYEGIVTILGGNSIVSIQFSPDPPGEYPIQFEVNESVPAHLWEVWVGNATVSSTLPIIALLEPNGSYSYSASMGGSYVPTQVSGGFPVDGHGLTIPLVFNPMPWTYPVVFGETGLPTGLIWSVSVNRSVTSTHSGTIFILLRNGTYSVSVLPPMGYVANPANSVISLEGQEQHLSIHFTKSPGTPATLLGVPWPVAYFLLGVSVATLLIVGGIILRKARKRRRSSSGNTSTKARPTKTQPEKPLPAPPKGHTWEIVREPLESKDHKGPMTK